MAIIIQTGHVNSYSSTILEKLYQTGLNQPLPSYNSKLTSYQVMESLAKLQQSNQSLLNNRFAESIAVDFLLGNLDNSDWGWAHADNLTMLDFWQAFEPSIRFLLIFDHPRHLLTQQAAALEPDELNTLFANWLSYHEQLLAFYRAYPDQCALLEGESVLTNFDHLPQRVSWIGATPITATSPQHGTTVEDNMGIDDVEVIAQDTDTLSMLLSYEILKRYPKVITLYNELLAEASMRQGFQIVTNAKPKLADLLKAFRQSKNHNQAKLDQLQLSYNEAQTALAEENGQLLTQLQHTQETLEKHFVEKQQAEAKLAQAAAELADADAIKKQLDIIAKQKAEIEAKAKAAAANNKDIAEENALLLNQLQQTQVAFEEIFLQQQRLQAQLKQLNDKLAKAEESKKQLDIVTKQKAEMETKAAVDAAQLAYKTTIITEHQQLAQQLRHKLQLARKAGTTEQQSVGLSEMQAKLQQVQLQLTQATQQLAEAQAAKLQFEAVAKQKTDAEAKAMTELAKLKAVQAVLDAQKTKPNLAHTKLTDTEATKRQLELLAKQKAESEAKAATDAAKLKASQAIIEEQKRLTEQLMAQLAQAKQQQAKADVKPTSATLAKSHTQAATQPMPKLTDPVVKKKPLAVSEGAKPSRFPIPVSAAERIQQDLPYRLGAKMVKAKNAKELAKLPLVLAVEYQNFKQEQSEVNDLLPLEAYEDLAQVERVKGHLSYRLGKALVDGAQAPSKLFVLPASVGKEILGFKKK